MVVGAGGELPLPWLRGSIEAAMQQVRGHGLLVHAAPGTGALEFALCLAQGWLCERRDPGRWLPCGSCESCHAVQQRSHPDLRVVLPEELRRATGWWLPGDAADSGDGDGEESRSKRKPSRQIRIDEVRAAIDWTATTASRGGAKVLVFHPAEAMNVQAANALLKTLEEPPGSVRLVLTAQDPALLLPTVRSRCQWWRLPVPGRGEGLAWLAEQGVAAPDVLLAGAGGGPQEALAWSRAGIDSRSWASLPAAVLRGDASVLSGWPLPRAIDALQRLCHDAMRIAVGGAPSYFPPGTMPATSLAALAEWQRELSRAARHDNHPWNEALLLESLVDQGRRAFRDGARPGAPPGATPFGTLRA